MSSNSNYSRSVDQARNLYFPLLKNEVNLNMFRSSPCFEVGNKSVRIEEEVTELQYLLEEACRGDNNFSGIQNKSKLHCPPAILSSNGCRYINLSLSNYEMAREVDVNPTDVDMDALKDPEIQDLLGSFERESDESSFLRKLRGEEDYSSSLSNSLGSEVTISRESSIFRDDLLFSRNDTPALLGEEATTLMDGSECERINQLVRKCNKSDVERYTLSFQDDLPVTGNSNLTGKLMDQEHNFKNGNPDDDQDLPVNLRRSTVNRCMNEQVLRDEIASPVHRIDTNYGPFMDEDRKDCLIRLFTAAAQGSPTSSGQGDSSMSVTSLESGPSSGAATPKARASSGNYRKTFEELERQRLAVTQALPIAEIDTSASQDSQEPFDVYLSESALEEFGSNPQNWLRRTSLNSTPKVSRSKMRKPVSHVSSDARAERPKDFTNFEKKSRSASSDTVYVCYPNYSLPDMAFVQKIIGQSSPGLVLSPTKPQLRTEPKRAKTRPKSFGGYERLSRQNFSHIKDWDSLNVLLPDDLKQILSENSKISAPPPTASFANGVLRRNKNRVSRSSHRFSLQEPLIATIPDEDEDEDEEKREGLARSETTTFGYRQPMRSPSTFGCTASHFCNHLPSPMTHFQPSHCCSSIRENPVDSLSKEKLNRLLSMSDALEEITSLLNMVTTNKTTSTTSNSSNDNRSSGSERNRVRNRPVSMTSCHFKSQIPVAKPTKICQKMPATRGKIQSSAKK